MKIKFKAITTLSKGFFYSIDIIPTIRFQHTYGFEVEDVRIEFSWLIFMFQIKIIK